MTALIILLSSCSSYSLVNSEVYDNAELAEVKTFHIVDLRKGKLPPGMEQSTYDDIADAIRRQMTTRGYKETPNSPILINFAVTVHDRKTQSPDVPDEESGPFYACTYPCYIYPQERYWSDYVIDVGVIDGIYNEGVLTIDVVNIKEKTPLYTSSVSSIVDEYGHYRDFVAIDNAVVKLFSQYPVAPLPQYSR